MKIKPILYCLPLIVLYSVCFLSCSDNNNDNDWISGGNPLSIITLQSVQWTPSSSVDSVMCLYKDNYKLSDNKYYGSKELIYKQNIKCDDDDYIEKVIGVKTASLCTYKACQDITRSKSLRIYKIDNITIVDTLYLDIKGSKTDLYKSNMTMNPVIGAIHYENGNIDKFEYDKKGNLIWPTFEQSVTRMDILF